MTSTAIDAAIELDVNTGVVTHELWPREQQRFQELLDLVPLELDKAADNRARFLGSHHLRHPSHLHFNAIAAWDGEVYGLFNRFGVVANLTRKEVTLQDDRLRRGHNLVITDEGTAILNDTKGQTVRFYDIQGRRLVRIIDLMEFRWVRRLLSRYMWRSVPRRAAARAGFAGKVIAKPLFVRGLDKVDDLVFVGLSPASLICVDVKTGRLVDAYQFARDVNACVHGLYVARDEPSELNAS